MVSSDRVAIWCWLFRHGDRSPMVGFPTSQYNESSWPQGYGQLTVKGMQQQKALGEFLRQRYNNFISTTYKRNEVYVQSTDVDRTLMSAATVMAGLFPPRGDQIWDRTITWQPIPVHTQAIVQDKMLAQKDACPVAEEVLQSRYRSPEVQNYTDIHQEMISRLHNDSGANFTNLGRLWSVYDTINCQKRHDYNIPPWATPEVLSWLRDEVVPYVLNLMLKGEEMVKMKQGVLLGKMIGDMSAKVSGLLDTEFKAFIYSAHDNTIAGLLHALQVYNDMFIPYSACIMLELYSRNSSTDSMKQNDHYVQIWYRNDSTHEPYQLQMPGCELDCPLDNFIHLSANFTSDIDIRERLCHPVQYPAITELYYVVIVSVSCGTILIAIMVGLSVYCHRKTRRRKAMAAARTYGKIREMQPEEMPMIGSAGGMSDEE